jgi:alpha-tubulin suppressor-like RCC1 family protein
VKTVTLTNTTGAPVSFTAVLASGSNSVFTVSPASGTIESDAQQVLTISAKGLAPGAPAATDSLLVQATALDAGATVKLSEITTAPVLKITPSNVDFSKVRVGESADASITIENTGNGPASLSLENDAGFVFSPSAVDVPADASVEVGISFAPQGFGDATAQLTLNASCGGTTLDLHGYGTGVATKVSGGQHHTCALFGGGKVACWGNNERGQLGIGVVTDPSPVPLLVPGIDDAVDVSCGRRHTCVVHQTGKVSCWGINEFGEVGNGADLGNGPPPDEPSPVEVVGIDDAVTVSVGNVSFALLQTGELKAWGTNEHGELGDDQAEQASSVPVYVLDPQGQGHLSNVLAVSTNEGSTLALLSDATAVCWGQNFFNQCGTGDSSGPLLVPKSVVEAQGTPPIPDVVGIAKGSRHGCVIQKPDDWIACWGYDDYGQVGDGVDLDAGLTNHAVKQAFWAKDHIAFAAAGYFHTCIGMIPDGQNWCWGNNEFGQLGTGNFDNASNAKLVPIGGKLVSLSAGHFHTCNVSSIGQIRCWGYNGEGALGVGYRSGLDAGADAPNSEFGIPSPQAVVGF